MLLLLAPAVRVEKNLFSGIISRNHNIRKSDQILRKKKTKNQNSTDVIISDSFLWKIYFLTV